jgi:hypothetical protein
MTRKPSKRGGSTANLSPGLHPALLAVGLVGVLAAIVLGWSSKPEKNMVPSTLPPIKPHETTLQEARTAHQQGDFASAISLYGSALKLNPILKIGPVVSSAYNSLGMQLWQQQRIPEAIACARASVRLEPRVGEAYTSLGLYLLSQQQEQGGVVGDEAEAALRRALAIKPAQPTAALALTRRAIDAALERHQHAASSSSLANLHATIERQLLGSVSTQAAREVLCGIDAVATPPPVGQRVVASAAAFHAAVFAGHEADDSGGAWLRDSFLLGAVRHLLHYSRPATVASAFPLALADRLHTALRSLEPQAWTCTPDMGIRAQHGGGKASLWTSRCLSMQTQQREEAVLTEVREMLNSAVAKKLIEDLTGERVSGETIVHFSRFRRGDFLSLHSDAGKQRRVAFAWHLANGWRPGMGGELAIPCAQSMAGLVGSAFTPPLFNQLTLFVTHVSTAASEHAVLPVVEDGASERLSVTGWFTSAAQDVGVGE